MATAPDKIKTTQGSAIGEIFSNVTVKHSISSYGTPKKSEQDYPTGVLSPCDAPHIAAGKPAPSGIRSQHSNRAVKVQNVAMVIQGDKKSKGMN